MKTPTVTGGVNESLAFASRTSHVNGIRLAHFEMLKQALDSVSQIAVAQYNMKSWYHKEASSQGSAVADERDHILPVICATFNSATAKETGKIAEYSRFWGTLVELIVGYKIRIVTGDFKMSLFTATTELRVRGCCVNMAAFSPWDATHCECKKGTTAGPLGPREQ